MHIASKSRLIVAANPNTKMDDNEENPKWIIVLKLSMGGCSPRPMLSSMSQNRANLLLLLTWLRYVLLQSAGMNFIV